MILYFNEKQYKQKSLKHYVKNITKNTYNTFNIEYTTNKDEALIINSINDFEGFNFNKYKTIKTK